MKSHGVLLIIHHTLIASRPMSQALLDRFFAGNRLALARVITLIENHPVQRETLVQTLHAHAGRARRIGLTGPPGAGKSTLLDRLKTCFRQENQTVGIIAVDPTSPFTGGALLGDRLRMQGDRVDAGVFVRSMADRTSPNGLAGATPDVILALDAFGKDVILVETVGVGQSTLAIADVTDTTIVVLTPESGDSIQAMKAGLMEIADLLVVNKADRSGSNQFASELRMVLEMRQDMGEWLPPVLKTSARDNAGIEALYHNLLEHQSHLVRSGALETRRLKQSRAAVVRALDEKMAQRIWAYSETAAALEKLADRARRREISPYAAADELMKLAGL